MRFSRKNPQGCFHNLLMSDRIGSRVLRGKQTDTFHFKDYNRKGKKKTGRDLLKIFVGSTIGTHIKIFFNVDFFLIFIEFVTILLLVYVLALWPKGTWDLEPSPARAQAHIPCVGR